MRSPSSIDPCQVVVPIPRKRPKPVDRSSLPRVTQNPSLSRRYFFSSFGGSVSPNTEIIPRPATFTLVSPGVGR